MNTPANSTLGSDPRSSPSSEDSPKEPCRPNAIPGTSQTADRSASLQQPRKSLGISDDDPHSKRRVYSHASRDPRKGYHYVNSLLIASEAIVRNLLEIRAG